MITKRRQQIPNPHATTPSQTITLDGRDWRIATDPDNTGREEKWFDVSQILGSAELSERWTVFETADRELAAGQWLEWFKTMAGSGVGATRHEFAVESGRLDLRVLPGWGLEGKTAYVHIPFNVREDGLHILGIGADWWHKAWIDGEVVSDTLATGNGAHANISMRNHLVKVQLCKGDHLLVVQLISGGRGAELAVGWPFMTERGLVQLSERWTVFELGVIEPAADQLSELPKTLTVGGAATTPHEFAVTSGRLDLRALLGWESQGKTAYVYIPFSVREDGLNTFGIGADGWHKAWIDGEVISDTLATGNGRRPPTMLDHLSKVPLCKGDHLLVVKFINASAGASLTVGGPSDFRRLTDDSSALQPQDARDELWLLRRKGVPGRLHAEVKPTPVPGVIQNLFPGYHGVAWYWRTFKAPANPHPNGRYLLQFGAVDYLAQVWVNAHAVGEHEGGETPFTLDVTEAIRPGQENLVAVRVLNPPEDRRIDDITLRETPSGAKRDKITCDGLFNSGGIVGAVELVMVPELRITDLHVRPDWKTGEIHMRATLVRRYGSGSVVGPSEASAQFSVTSAAGGAPLDTANCHVLVEAGTTAVEASLRVPDHRLWSVEDPALYRVTATVQVANSPSVDERSVRCGFRDFRFENGYFQLNGRRIFLKGAINVVHFPITYTFPHDPELMRRDASTLKKAGYNLVRIAFRSMPHMLDIFDEVGLLAYQGHYGEWMGGSFPGLKARWNASVSEVLLRDRNHPCLAMVGLLNETQSSLPLFQHAVTSLPMVRELDPTRVVILNSGRFDGRAEAGSLSNPGSLAWEGKMSDLLDHHEYPFCPLSQEAVNVLRTRGKGAALFQSEYGQCGTMDLPSELAQFKRLGQEQGDDARFFRKMMDDFMADWIRWRLDDIWQRPEEYFTDGMRNYARIKAPGETALRSNPALVAYSSTHTAADSTFAGQGLTTLFREPKDPALMEGARLTTAPLRWCLFAAPDNIYRGSRVRFEVVLADEDTLPAGEYPARVEILGPDRRPIATREIRIRLGDSTDYRERAFATACFREEIVVDGPAGAYELVVTMSDGRQIPGNRLAFHVDDPGTMPAMPPDVTLWGEDAALSGWLTRHGVQTIPFDPLAAKRQIIAVGARPPAPGRAEAFAELFSQIARGSAVVFFDRNVFGNRLPLAGKALRFQSGAEGYYRWDWWNKSHAIFQGLPAGGMMDYDFYGGLISLYEIPVVDDLAKPALTGPRLREVVCGATRTSSLYASGLSVAVYELGAGRFILNTLNILPNLGTHPAAERLLRNMLNHAARDIEKPLADLPADFDKQLETMGYK
jgi:hypothetical protein